MRYALLLPVASLLLSACAKDHGQFPTLARRPGEQVTGTIPVPPAPVPPPAPSAEALGSLDGLVAKARAAHAKFSAAEPRARALVGAAAGAAVASESWSVATVALADLESQRSEAMIALADLDALYAAEGIRQADTTAITAAREQVIGLVASEDAVLIALRGRLRS